METLNYKTLKDGGYAGYLLEDAPIKMAQFGEGNFLRAFVEYFVDVANEKTGFGCKVALVQPIATGGLRQFFEEQQNLYTLYLRGILNGEEVNQKRVISAVGDYIDPYADYAAFLGLAANPDLRYVASNTTEAGIVYTPDCKPEDAPPESFPAKLALFLYERWKQFGGAKDKGIVVLSCELIDDNGKELAGIVRRHIREWGLPAGFLAWVNEDCLFCSTLVDRIVTGYPRAEADALNTENGYTDNLLDTGEIFGLWVIEGPAWLAEELPFAKAGLPVKVVEDHTPYKKQKVRILNGAHTSMVPAAYLSGIDFVRDAMYDEDILTFFKRAVWEEIIPVLPLPREELESFATAVEQRFKNPYINHDLLSITLNATSKWRARVLPTVKEYIEKNGSVPRYLAFSMAAHIAFCQSKKEGGKTCGSRNGEAYELHDDGFVLDFFLQNSPKSAPELTRLVLADTEMWGEDLTALPGFEAFVAGQLEIIRTEGMRNALKRLNATQ